MLITVGVTLLFWLFIFFYVKGYMEERQNLLSDYVGTKLISDKDTVEVIGYDYWYGSLKLSKGYSVSPEYVEMNKIK